MAHTLNLVLPLVQDAESKAKLAEFANTFPTLQGRIAQVIKESEILRFARIVVVEDKYITVLTEYDGDKRAYTRFFQEKLADTRSSIPSSSGSSGEGRPTGQS